MATYYIATTGNDTSGNGSIGTPWATLHKACQMVTTTGNTIYISGGTYTEAQQSILSLGVNIIGAGKDVVTINYTYTGGGAIEMWSASLVEANTTISGIKIDGQNIGYGGINITRRSNVNIDNCTFVNLVSGGTYAMDGYDSEANSPAIYNVNVTNCIFTDCTRYLASGSYGAIWHRGVKDYVVTNNIVTANFITGDLAGFLLKASRVQNVRISGNTLSVIGHDDGAKWAFAIEYNHVLGGIQIDNNTIQGVIDFAGYRCMKGLYNYSLWIHHNIMGHQSLSTRYQDCIYLENYSLNSGQTMSDVIIEDNTITSVTKGITFMKVSTDNQTQFHRINIRRNTITNVGIISGSGLGWGITWNGDGGVFNDINIYNNTIIGSTSGGTNTLVGINLPVRNSTTTNYRIINNIIQGFDNAAIFTDGSYLTGTIDYLYIQNNDFYQNGQSNNPKWWGIVPTNYTSGNTLKVDPLFFSTTNFRLQSGSTLINAGLDVGLLYNGTAPDIGANEYGFYYISPTGNNNNSGTINSPWLTLYYACTQVTATGSTIFVKSGTYLETQQCNLSIGVNIKGEGSTSIINSNISTQYVSTILLHSDSEGINGNQYISGITMTGSNKTAWGAILINGRSNVSIHDCSFTDFKDCGVVFNGATSYINQAPTIYATGNTFFNNYIRNCSSYDLPNGFGNGGLQLGAQDGMLVYNNIMSQTGRTAGTNGYVIKYYSDGYNKNIKIYNNTITKAPFSALNNDFDFAVEMWNHRGGVEIYNNTIIGSIDVGGESNLKGNSTYSCWIHDNTIGPTTMLANEEVGVWLERECFDVIIDSNYFKNLSSAVFFVPAYTDNVARIRISRNIMDGIGTTSGSFIGYAIRWTTVTGQDGTIVDDIKILNNTIIGKTTNDMAGIMLPDVGTATNVVIKNNIIVDFDWAPIYSNTSGTINGLSIENNLMYLNANNNDVLISGNAPTNYTLSNNLKNDPLFISSTDFRLQSGSTAINAGVDVGLPYTGSAPDIGAFEYDGSIVKKVASLNGKLLIFNGKVIRII